MSREADNARQIATLSVDERIDARRRHGDTPDQIGAYAHDLLQTVETCRHTKIRTSEKELQKILSADEYRAFKRRQGEMWRARTTRQLIQARDSRHNAPSPGVVARRSARELARSREEEATKELRRQGAMSRSKVAALLGITHREVDRLRTRGLLVPNGFITIRGSYGRKCHVWLPTTVEAYLYRPITNIDSANRVKR